LTENPLNNINFYLSLVYKEAQDRGYNFNKNKIDWKFKSAKLKVTEGQIKYEVVQLKKKLKIRNKNKYREMTVVNRFSPHPLFKIVKGEIEGWEKVKY
jgi:hypothetical protein